MRRGSRKKNDASSSKEEQKAQSASISARRQQPSQEVFEKQMKKQQDSIASLTTKNYRLAKELADLRLKHRDECKHVTRLTMENMNLASRCREAISHVAMLKKELAMQQKRTAKALASQREQTKRMADSLTNSFISFSSPESVDPNLRHSSHEGRRISLGLIEDENVMRLVSETPSPNRTSLHNRLDNSSDENESYSELVVQASATTTTATTSTRASSTSEEPRDSPATTATNSPRSELDEDDTVADSIALNSSSLSASPAEEKIKTKEEEPVIYSTPKKIERTMEPKFQVEKDNGFDDTKNGKPELFPFSASPQVFDESNSGRGHKSYDEEFPSDTIDQAASNNNENYVKSKKMNLMNSIDAFEQSFSTDFPNCFTPKETSSNGSVKSSASSQNIYNPFSTTPEKDKAQKEEKKTGDPSEVAHLEYKTPPGNAKKNLSVTSIDKNEKDEQRPKRPEKVIPSAARARYERALGPRVESSTQNKPAVRNEAGNSSLSDTNSPGALYRRIQQKKRLDKSLEALSSRSLDEGPSVELSSSGYKRQSSDSILNIVDAFESNESQNADADKKQPPSPSRFKGPIRSMRRRSVKKPISYAEPALNTKLRRGDTFFPKTEGLVTMSGDDQNQAPNRNNVTAVISP